MNNAQEFSGRTIEEAVNEGLEALGLDRSEADIEVVQHPRRKFLGRVDAVVRVAPLADWNEEEDASAQRVVTGQPEPSRPEAEPEDEAEPASPADDASPAPQTQETLAYDVSMATPEGQEENERVARETLGELLDCMDIGAYTVNRSWSEHSENQPLLTLHVEGAHLGRLIGRRGSTLNSLQFILRLMLSQKLKSWPYVNLDIDQYQLKRQQALARQALKIAREVVERGRPYEMESMSPAHRRIVHLTLQDHPDVYTESEGTGSDRRVVVYLK